MKLLKQLTDLRPITKGQLHGLLAGILIHSSASAATFVWDINGDLTGAQDGTGAWSPTDTNWYDPQTQSNSVWDNSGNHIAQFNAVGNPASVITLSGSGYQLGGMNFTSVNLPNSSGNSHEFTGTSTLTLKSGAIIDAGTNSRVNLGNNVSLVASGGFTKTGGGVFIVRKFSGAIGNTVVEEGALDIYGSANFSKLTFSGSGRLVSHSGTHIRAEQMIFDTSGNSAFAAPGSDSTYTIGSGGLILKKGSIYFTADTARMSLKLEGDVSFEGDSSDLFDITVQGSAAADMKGIDLNNETRKFNVETGKTLRIAPIIQNGTLHKKGAGTLELRGANTYAGGTYIENGRVLLYGSALIGPATSTVTLESTGILDLGGTDQTIAQLEGSGTVQNTRGTSGTNTLTISSDTKNSTFSGGLNDVSPYGKIALVKSGSSTLNLSGVSTYSGGTTLQAGKLAVTESNIYDVASNNYVTKAFGTGAMKLEGGTIQIRLNGTNTTTVQTLRYDNNLSLEGNVTFDIGREGGTGTGKQIRFGALTVTGDHTLTVQSANSYVLGLASVALNHHFNVNTVATAGGVTVAGAINGANYDVNKYGSGALVYSGGTFRDLNIYGGKVDFFNTNTVRNVTVSGTGYFTTHSGNTWNVETLNYNSTSTSNNFYTAAGTSLFNFNVINLSVGGLRWQSDSGTADTAMIKVVLKDQLNVTGNSSFLNEGGGLAQKLFDLNNGQRTINVSNGVTFTNNIRFDNGSYVKVGGGKMIVTTAATHAGGTLVQGGTLEINATTGSGTGTGSVQVTNATLSGIGRLAPSAGNKVTLGAGSLLTPGSTAAAIGTLTIVGNAEFLAGSSPADRALLSLQLSGKNSGQFDRLLVDGNLDFQGAVALSFANGFNGSTLVVGDSFDFVDWTTASFSGFDVASAFDLPSLEAYGLAWNTSMFSSNGTLSVVMAVPEPCPALLMLFGLGSISVLYRKRKRA